MRFIERLTSDDESADMTVQEVLDVLVNARRRIALRTIADSDDGDGVELGTVSDIVAATEADTDPESVDTDHRKAVYVAVYQNHVPHLEDAEMITTDGRGHSLRVTDRGLTALDVLAAIEREVGS